MIIDKRMNLKCLNMMKLFKQFLLEDVVSKYNRFETDLSELFAESSRLESEIKSNLKSLKYEG